MCMNDPRVKSSQNHCPYNYKDFSPQNLRNFRSKTFGKYLIIKWGTSNIGQGKLGSGNFGQLLKLKKT